MKPKLIATFLAFSVIFSFAYAQPPLVQMQFPAELNYKQTKMGGGIARHGSKNQILFSIGVSSLDSNTTLYYPSNQLNIYTNFSYFTNCALVQVSFSVHSSIPVDQMLYSVTTDKDPVPQWKKLSGRFVKQNEANGDYSTNIFLDPIECRDQVFTVKLYDTKDPGAVLSQIVSTVPVEQPKLFANLFGYHLLDSVEVNGVRVPKKTREQTSLQNASLTTWDMGEFADGDIYLNTNNSPYVYRVYLVRNRKRGTDTLPLFFTWAELNNKIIKANNSFDLNKAPYRNIYSGGIIMELIRAAGSYELLVVPAFLKSSRSPAFYAGKKASIKFEVHTPRTIDESYVILYSLLFLLMVLLFFIWYKRKQRRKLKQQQQFTREAKLKLEAVRSQLNPHFIFNALAGIQNLMNKNEISKAQNYLASFSRITRSVLNNSSKELITVDEEIKWLTDYLDMEQLRFGFHYTITADKDLDRHNVEIPGMLLQPFIENAIKHGIASLKENGRIDISFHKLDSDMQVKIKDNGNGFDTSKEYNGAGLRLSKSRIDLLNTVYKNTPAQLTVDSTTSGTTVLVTLKNWL